MFIEKVLTLINQNQPIRVVCRGIVYIYRYIVGIKDSITWFSEGSIARFPNMRIAHIIQTSHLSVENLWSWGSSILAWSAISLFHCRRERHSSSGSSPSLPAPISVLASRLQGMFFEGFWRGNNTVLFRELLEEVEAEEEKCRLHPGFAAAARNRKAG